MKFPISLGIMLLAAWMYKGVGHASGEVFKWVDKEGTVHYTDDPERMPEPFRSRALRRIEEKEQRKKQREETQEGQTSPHPHHNKRMDAYGKHERLPPLPPPKPAPTTPRIDPAKQREEQKKVWQEIMAAARSQVAELEAECQRLQEESHQANRNSLLYGRPMDTEQANQASSQLSICATRLNQARHNLEVELPEQARKNGIPPGWLR